MATTKVLTVREQIEKALDELETVSDEIRVKLHLAGMDARDTWSNDIEPRVEAAKAALEKFSAKL